MTKFSRAFLVALGVLALPALDTRAATSRSLTLDERVTAQRAIEEVYWRHRIWPKDNSKPKPSLDATMPASAIRAKVEDYLKQSSVLDMWWRRPITGDQLQAELDRMARGTRDPRVLQELFDALGNDPVVIAETLARPVLAERLARNWYATDERFKAPTCTSVPSFNAWWKLESAKQQIDVTRATGAFSLPALDSQGCTNDTWGPTLTEVPDHRLLHTTIWTGTEMIVWGGESAGYQLNTGGRYNPATDTWTPTSTGANVPLAAYRHTAVWTGTEMIVWGGAHIDESTGGFVRLNSGARYDPANDSWTPTSTGANVPAGREMHLAVWTGMELIVWGGVTPDPRSGGRYHPVTDSWTTIAAGADALINQFDHKAVWTGTEMIVWASPGGRYNPVTNNWSPMSTSASVPLRSGYTAVWTGTEVIVWGGSDSGQGLRSNTGGRYNPSTDTWTATSTGVNVPSPRAEHTAIWTGSKMIVWGGQGPGYLNSGASYDPSNDSWVATASNTLDPRGSHTAIWTGTEMIVWGGFSDDFSYHGGLNTGGRYNPTNDSWVATSTGASVPAGRHAHTAVWTGTEMIVWGGQPRYTPPTPLAGLNTGGRYTPATDSWVPTSVSSGVPEARTAPSAVWTGTEMIVWGGLGADWLNTGGRYNPITDSWSATSTGVHVPPNVPTPRSVWTGREMIVWGSLIWNDPSTATGGRYDPATNSWRAMASGPTTPEFFGTPYAWTGHEMIVWGNGPEPGSRYNPMTDSWAAISTGGNAPNFRDGYAQVWTGSEMIVWGGFSNTGGRYSPSTDSWLPTSTGANVPSLRTVATAVWTGSEMLVWGGGNANSGNPATVGGRYNPTTNSWLPMSIRPNGPSPVPTFHTAVWTGTEMIVWGGMPGTSTGGRYCACPLGRLVYRDVDGDGFGDPGNSSASCDGSAPAGYVVDFTDCNDASAGAHPGAAETCNGIDDNCNGLVDDSASGEDVDGDSIRDVCDNCAILANVTQSDFDHDGQGDACDLNDGLIYEWRNDKTSVSWQAEAGPTSWNVYVGDLAVLRATGVYTQPPGANALATRQCGVVTTGAGEPGVPAPGKGSFSLVTGVLGDFEGSLGSATSGPRTNANPCP